VQDNVQLYDAKWFDTN